MTTGFNFLLLFALNFLMFPCEGQITSPPGGTNFTFLPGSTAKIQWKFDNDIKTVLSRIWTFTSSDGSESVIARIVDDDPPREIPNNTLPGVTIEKPATLVLNNVDKRYNGKYKFEISPGGHRSQVVVFIAEKPAVMFSCSSSITVNEDGGFTCVCRGEGGNPPADVTWYDKDGVQIGKTGKEEQTLSLSDVSRTDSGTYECEARSHTDDRFSDKKSVEVEVNFKPDKTAFTFKPDTVVVGEPVTLTCESYGRPEPSYTIVHNDSRVSTKKMYTISKVKWSDAGTYQCIAENKLGSNSRCYCLTVGGKIAASKEVDSESSAETVVVWHIIVSLVCGIIIGILFSYIVSCSCRRWFRKRNRKPEQQPTEADTTYQELDLTKLNAEENYQSLKVNNVSYDARKRAANDDDSTYTELNKTRDMENNYQSLT